MGQSESSNLRYVVISLSTTQVIVVLKLLYPSSKWNKALVMDIYDPFTGKHYTSCQSIFLYNLVYTVNKIIEKDHSEIYCYYKTLAHAIGSISNVRVKAIRYNWTGYIVRYCPNRDLYYQYHYLNGHVISREKIYKRYHCHRGVA